VGAVDLCAEPVHLAAARDVLPASLQTTGDAAVVLVLKRLDDARRDRDRILAIVTDATSVPSPARTFGSGHEAPDLVALFGHAHAASGLVHVAAAVLACHHRWGAGSTAEARVLALGGQEAMVWLREDPETLPDGVRSDLPASPWEVFAAHPPTPRFPPFDSTRPVGATHMEPAPSLPRILELTVPDIAVESPSSVPAPSLAASDSSRYQDPVVLRRQAQQRQLAAIHAQFVAQQSALHQQFLHVQSRALHALLAAAGGEQPAPPPAKRSFSRADLEVHASGTISTLFGPLFEKQDSFAVQVRMPEPPLLLADRVTDVRADAGTMGLGTVWTETDVREDSWYLNAGYMPAGILIEAGQADLFLISYLGVDFLNQGERAYRLLGCELTYHRSLPKPGETLRYEITIDSHAEHGDVRLFFFHYDCTIDGVPVLTVRNGQAGFFTRRDLAESAGVLWKPEEQAVVTDARVDPPAVVCERSDFTPAQVRAFAGGDLFTCFGRGFERGQTHTRTPAIQTGDMLFLDRVLGFDPTGGPWGRGYMKATTAIHPAKWFFGGHFKNDPCMPGTLMFEGCLQMMAFFVAGLGYTLEKDGWRFEPVIGPGESSALHCRGQVLPDSKELVCEIFVEEVQSGPTPTIYADLLGTVDGLKAFHARRMGLRLVPDWPLTSRPALPATVDSKPVASRDGFAFGYGSLLACALGKPSDAFGPMYAPFDGHRRVARLPSPPYHFMSRVVRIEGAIGVLEPGAWVEIEYDIPADAWYFGETGSRSMPFCVLLEAALQPCGWLASFVGSALTTDEDLCFRNLDGKGTFAREILPRLGAGMSTLRTVATLKSVSQSGTMILQSFDVTCFVGDERICELTTGFGFFPSEALRDQVGLATTPTERQRVDAPNGLVIDLTASPARYCGGTARLPAPMLRMLDRITAFVPDGGDAKLGFVRGEKDVNAAEWFFKAHFFQDPVQPGSLGVQAMLQLLQFYMLHTGMDRGFEEPVFEAIATDREASWRYRGQVVPTNERIRTTAQIIEAGRDARGAYVVADASLWVDEKQIYRCATLGMRIVEGKSPRVDLAPIRAFWGRQLGLRAWPGEDIYRALVASFVRRVAFADEEALRSHAGRGVVYLANHQVGVESTAFAILASALGGRPVLTLAKIENRRHWLELVMKHTFAYPGVTDPGMVIHFDRAESESLPGIIETLAAAIRDESRSVMVHVEGTRSLECRSKVTKMSGMFIDMAIAVDRPIVPVRFVGGLPSTPLAARLELPLGMAKQDYYLGAPILPPELARLSYKARIERVVDAINALGPPNAIEEPHAGDPRLEDSVRGWTNDTGAECGPAALFRLLVGLNDACDETRALVQCAGEREARFEDSPKGRWLAELARMLYGPRGPRVAIG
jgi:3-hydroxymyristoyl/3-hydroxydecanoyl-(acyl carrier protein) dehydratase/1-acyl-sn-glycerol-3-phosphate acyltransferase